MSYDIDKEIRVAVESGKVRFGSNFAEKELLVGDAKLVIMASNLSKEKQQEYARLGTLAAIKIYKYAGSSIQLGNVCGKPFPVSMMVIYEEGNSKILSAVQGQSRKSKG